MIFKETELKGAFIVEPECLEDERGFFARTWSEREFAERGLSSKLTECNLSFNKRKGTLRGMHYQVAPHSQVKIVRCTAGAIYDVIIDLRNNSETFKQWTAVKLSAANRLMLYVPEDFAHGFQTLEDNSEVFYQMSANYAPGCARGVRWDDPAFSIVWPPDDRTIIDRDQNYPTFL
jgi:dTDP-4-dehydrorhamnose 3,5-epimerase